MGPGRCDCDVARGSGHRPPFLLVWPELLLSQLLFPGHLGVDLPAACRGFSLCPFLTLLLLTWREPGGDKGDQRAPLIGYPAPLKSLACYCDSKTPDHPQGTYGGWHGDCRARGSVHDPRPPFLWLCSGSCLSLVLLPLMHLSLDFAPPPSTQPSPSCLVPPAGSGASPGGLFHPRMRGPQACPPWEMSMHCHLIITKELHL